MKFILIIWTAWSCCNNSIAEFDTKIACEQAKSVILNDLERSRQQRVDFMRNERPPTAPLTEREIPITYPVTRGECFSKG